MGNPTADFSDPLALEQGANRLQTGLDTNQLIVYLDELVCGWRERERLDVLILRALLQLTRGQQSRATDGFTPWDIVEAVGAIRGRPWSSSDNKEQMSDDVRRHWNRLQDLWESKHEGVVQHLSDLQVGVFPVLAKTEGGGTGRPTRYRIEWQPLTQPTDQHPPGSLMQQVAPGEIRYVCEDIEDAGPLGRIFARGYNLCGWRRVLYLVLLLLPLLFCWLVIVQVVAALTASSALGGKSLISSVASLIAVFWATWATAGPLFALGTKRIVLAPWWMQSVDDDQLLEIRSPPRYQAKSIKAVRYTTTCPICGAKAAAKSGGWEFRGRIVGRCDDAPVEHVFSFDHVTRGGKRLR